MVTPTLPMDTVRAEAESATTQNHHVVASTAMERVHRPDDDTPTHLMETATRAMVATTPAMVTATPAMAATTLVMAATTLAMAATTLATDDTPTKHISAKLADGERFQGQVEVNLIICFVTYVFLLP